VDRDTDIIGKHPDETVGVELTRGSIGMLLQAVDDARTLQEETGFYSDEEMDFLTLGEGSLRNALVGG